MRSSKSHIGHETSVGNADRGSHTPGPGKATLTQALPAIPAASSTTEASAPPVSSPDQSVSTEPVSVAIPMTGGTSGAAGAPGATADKQVSAPGATAGKQDGAQGHEQGGAMRVVADIEGDPIVSNQDAVAPVISYTGSITRGGITLGGGEFGRTDSVPSLGGINITQTASVFHVTATYQLLTKWDTRHGTGPDGQHDVPDENAPVLTAANYATAASDLTPNMSDEGGRPPRTQFWAQDLTERHEQLHAREHQQTGREGLRRGLEWLATQTASTQADVEALLRGLQTRIVQYILANGAGSVGELHAYGDGAPLYRARATAIRVKGTAGGYP